MTTLDPVGDRYLGEGVGYFVASYAACPENVVSVPLLATQLSQVNVLQLVKVEIRVRHLSTTLQ